MKIIEIIPQLSSGGAERFVVDLCNELVGMGHEVTLIVFHNVSKHGFYLQELDGRVQLVGMDKGSGMDLGFLCRLTRYLVQARPDVVHTHLRAILYIYPSLLLSNGVMHCHTVHTAARQEAGGGISARLRRYLFGRKLILPVTISEESERSFEEYYGYGAPMIPNGRNVDPDLQVSPEVRKEIDSYKSTPKSRVLVCLARIMKVKRQTMLAQIAKRLEGKYDFSVLLIGRLQEEAMGKEIEALQSKSVHLLGERHNPLEYLKAADAFCLCSSYEGAPMSLIEALGTGCVPVCSPVGSIVDIVENGRNGFVASDLTEEAYQEKLEAFLKLGDNEVERYSQAALASYAPYSMKTCAERYVKLFEERRKKR